MKRKYQRIFNAAHNSDGTYGKLADRAATTDSTARPELIDIEPEAVEALVRKTNQRSVVLRGFRVTGSITLNDFRPRDGDSPKALELRGCVIEGDIWLRSSHLSRLSVRGTALRSLDARDAQIDGSVDISHIHSCQHSFDLKEHSEDPDDWSIEPDGFRPAFCQTVRQRKDIKAWRERETARLRTELGDTEWEKWDEAIRRYGDRDFVRPKAPDRWWDFSTAEDFEKGGSGSCNESGPRHREFGLCFVNLSGARIAGSVFVIGARLVGPVGSLRDGPDKRKASAPTSDTTRGPDASHGETASQNKGDASDGDYEWRAFLPPALNITHAKIAADIYFEPNRRSIESMDGVRPGAAFDCVTAVIGQIKLRGAQIDGDFAGEGLVVWGLNRPAINGAGATIKGRVNLTNSELKRRFVARGEVLFRDARIGRGVELSGGVFLGRYASLDPLNESNSIDRSTLPVEREYSAVDFTNSKIGGNFLLTRSRYGAGDSPILGGDLLLDGAMVGGDLKIKDVRAEDAPSYRPSAVLVSAKSVTVDNNLTLVSRIEGACFLDGARIGGSLWLAEGGTNLSFVYTKRTDLLMHGGNTESASGHRANLGVTKHGLSMRQTSIGSTLYVREITPVNDALHEEAITTSDVPERGGWGRAVRTVASFADFPQGRRWTGRARLAVSSLQERSRESLKLALGQLTALMRRNAPARDIPLIADDASLESLSKDNLAVYSEQLEWLDNKAWVRDFRFHDTQEPPRFEDRYFRLLEIEGWGPFRSFLFLDGDGADLDQLNQILDRPLFRLSDPQFKKSGSKSKAGIENTLHKIRKYIEFYLSCNWDELGWFGLGRFDPAKCQEGSKPVSDGAFLPIPISTEDETDEKLIQRIFGEEAERKSEYFVRTKGKKLEFFMARCVIIHAGHLTVADLTVRADGRIEILDTTLEACEDENKIERSKTNGQTAQSHAQVRPPFYIVERSDCSMEECSSSGDEAVRILQSATHARPLVKAYMRANRQLSAFTSNVRRRVLSGRIQPDGMRRVGSIILGGHTPVIDLRGASVGVLDDQFGNGWRDYSSRAEPDFRVRLLLDGFTYQQIAGVAASEKEGIYG